MHKVITLPEGRQRCEDSDGFFVHVMLLVLKEQAYLHPDGDLVGITFTLRPAREKYVMGVIA